MECFPRVWESQHPGNTEASTFLVRACRSLNEKWTVRLSKKCAQIAHTNTLKKSKVSKTITHLQSMWQLGIVGSLLFLICVVSSKKEVLDSGPLHNFTAKFFFFCVPWYQPQHLWVGRWVLCDLGDSDNISVIGDSSRLWRQCPDRAVGGSWDSCSLCLNREE